MAALGYGPLSDSNMAFACYAAVFLLSRLYLPVLLVFAGADASLAYSFLTDTVLGDAGLPRVLAVVSVPHTSGPCGSRRWRTREAQPRGVLCWCPCDALSSRRLAPPSSGCILLAVDALSRRMSHSWKQPRVFHPLDVCRPMVTH